jgi:hypothetical protein
MTELKIAHCYFCPHIPPENLSPQDKWKEVATHILKFHKKIPKRTKVWIAHVLAERKERIEIKPVSKDPDYKPTELGVLNRLNSKVQLSGEMEEVLCYCSKCHRDHKKSLETEFLRLAHPWLINGKPVMLCAKCIGSKIKYG